MKKISLVSFLLIVAIIFSYNAYSLDEIKYKSMDEKLPVDSKVKIGKLKNGITYYIRKNSKPENHAHFRLVIRAGAVQEDDDQNGLAHFCEHMAFNGTKNYPKNELVDFLESTGIRFGADLNASTNTDVTMYELPIPLDKPEFLESTFQVLEDWAHNVSYDGDMIDGERGVIMSEWRQRNNFQMRIMNAHADKLYYKSKYAKRNIIGDTSIILNCEHDALRRFYKDWYRPDLMALIAVGDFDIEKIEAMIKDHFSKIEMHPDPRPRNIVDVPDHKEMLVSIASDKELPVDVSFMYFKKPLHETGKIRTYYNSSVESLIDIMFAGRMQEILQKPNPPFVQGGGRMSRLAGNKEAYSLQAISKSGGIMKAIDAVLSEAFRVKKHGFTSSELERAKLQYLTGFEQGYNQRNSTESVRYVSEYTRCFTRNEDTPGIEYEYALAKTLLPKISVDDINKVASTYLTKENAVITIGMAEKTGLNLPTEKEVLDLYTEISKRDLQPYSDMVSDKPLFSQKVTPGKVVDTKEIKSIDTKVLTLSNGVRIVLKQTDFKEDQILFRAFSPGGTSLSSDEDYTSATIASQIISSSGIADFDNTTLTKLLAGKNLNVSVNIDELTEGFRGSCSLEDTETMFQLINLYFTAPRGDLDSYKSFMSRIKSFIENRSMNPENAFSDTIQVTMANHHYRERPMTMELLKEIDFDKALDFFNDRFADAGDFTFVFVGNIDMKKITPMIETYLGSLPTKGRKENWKNVGIEMPVGKISKRIKKGEEDRSHVRLILSGAFDWSQENRHLVSSLVELFKLHHLEEIREKRSGVYSPGIWVETDKYPTGEYRINIDFVCEPKRVDELVDATLELLEDMKYKLDIPGTEKVKEAQRKERKINLKNNNYWLGNLYFYYLNGDNPESIMKYDKLVESLSAGDLKNAAKKYFRMNNLVKIVLDPENVQ